MNVRRFCVLVVALLLVLPVTAHALAQDGTELQCTAEDIAGSMSAVRAVLDQAQAALDSGDLSGALASLDQSVAAISDVRSKCNGWYFTGDGNDVIGPLQLEGGVYKLEYAGAVPGGILSIGMFMVDFENVDEEEWVTDSVMEVFTESGDFAGGTSVRLDGGRYLISVDAAYLDEWTLRLTKP